MNRVLRFLSAGVCCLLLPACTPKPSPAAAPAPAPAPTATPAPPAVSEREKLLRELGQPPGPPPMAEEEEGALKPSEEIVVDPVTKQRLQRVPKGRSFYVKSGRLYSAVVNDPVGFPVVKEDEKFWYVPAPDEATPEAKEQARLRAEQITKAYIYEVPDVEAETVTPRVSKKRIVLQDVSKGLPRTGIWRDNFALADLDGDGRPEIVAPPPRLSGEGMPRIFRFEGDHWTQPNVVFENPGNRSIGYGGVAVGDIDGDGRPDIVGVGHGSGAWSALNRGNLRFTVEALGLPEGVSSRAIEFGDLDGDGKPDVVIVSDVPEKEQSRQAHPREKFAGYDARAFINQGGRFVELLSGLEDACFGYNLALYTPKEKSGTPFYVSSCRMFSSTSLLYTFDRKKMTFEPAGRDVVEFNSAHIGSAVGRYRGAPAAFVSWLKNNPAGASRDMQGFGVSVYWQDGATWKRKRVLKVVGPLKASQGIAVGDLDGDGLDDVVYADELTHKLRVFFQTAAGEFEELDPALEPEFPNHASSVRIADVDGDGRPDIVLMLHYLTEDATRWGGLRFYRNVAPSH